jgi:hypothetical protein
MNTIFCESIERVSQGDIFRDIDYLEHYQEKNGIISISKITFPYVYVLTQDCDLAQDFKFRTLDPPKGHDKYLISVLIAPIYNAEFVYSGEHLSDLGYSMQNFASGPKRDFQIIKSNKNPRYHFLDFGEDSTIPPSIIDFKQYFSINIRYLESIKNANRVFKLKTLFREDVSQRFSSFLSRIGLPEVE